VRRGLVSSREQVSRHLRNSINDIEDKDLYPPISMFEKGTNIDEINIIHASKRLLSHPSNTKLLVVLSDGMTRGSVENLKSSIKFATKQGIEVIGIGIGNRGSWKEYQNNVQVEHPEQLIHSIVNITKDILIKNAKKTIGVA
jgi:cobalamin biosynthesis protein CobT